MIDVKLAKIEDVVASCRDAVDESVRLHPETWQRRSEGHLENGPALSLWNDGSLLGCVGVEIRREGVGIAWAVIMRRPELEQPTVIRGLVRSCRVGLDVVRKHFGVTRIRTFSVKGFPEAGRLLRAFQFERLRRESKTRFYYRWTG